MSIKNGRNGKVSWDPAGGATLVQIASLNKWTLDNKTDFEDVTCWGDSNKVWSPGFMDVAGSFAGFWNSTELALFKAAVSGVPGTLQLTPNTTESTFFWQGLAYLDASIDCSLNSPKVTGTFKAAGSWQVPGAVVATGAGPGTGNGTFTPAGASAPRNLAALSGVTASPATAWSTGQRIVLADGSTAYWNGTGWVAGVAP
jgi:hypothetical protein